MASNIIWVENVDNPALDPYVRLTEPQLRSKLEPKKGIFIAESPKVIERALNAGLEPLSLLMEEKHVEGDAAHIIERCADIPTYVGPRGLLTELTGFKLTRGVLCAMRRPELPSVEEVLEGAHRIAVLENINNHTNIGAIFRSAAALNIDAVLLTPTSCDPLFRRAARVSMGAVFQVPWTRIGKEAKDWPNPGLSQLKEAGFAIASLALHDDSVTIDDPRLKSEEKLALVFGAEGDGLAQATIDQSDYVARIPMAHGVDSLNVAAASAVVFWELCCKQ